ncbi:MAG TPA: ribosome-associated translation inhibitor RaiA [Candidatus Paceibacterota bacterium]|jgi:ribosomal subunit interface protein|nr:ribosome-associated translation inhibitor RaiA [Candidatus Paceibacterota bacterium]
MKINTKATNMELTQAINDYVAKMVEAIEKFIDLGDESAILDIEVGKTTNHHRTGDYYRAEVNLEWAGRQYYSAAEKDDLYAAIDEVKDQVVSELAKSKDKHAERIREGGKEAKEMLHKDPSEEEIEEML